MKFLKQLSLYTFAGFFGAGVNFFILPVLSHYLSPLDYGVLSIINSYVTILIPLIGLVASGLISVEYFKLKDRKEFAAKFVSVQAVPIVPFVLLSLLFFSSYDQLSGVLELTNTHRVWALFMMFLALATIYVETFLNLLIIQKKATAYSIYNITRVVIEVALTLWLVVQQGLGWQGRLYAWIATSAIFLVIGFLYFKKEGLLSEKIEWRFMKEGILFGLPLILHTIGKFVINQSDRLFIAKMVSLEEAGIYNMGYTIGTLILIVITAFFNFYTPFLMERLATITEEKKLQIVKMSYLFAIGAIAVLIIVSVFAPLLFSYFIDRQFESAVQYVFWVGLGYVFWGGYMLFANYINYFKRNRLLGWLAGLNVLTNTLFNYVLIKMFGAIGAAYATALSFLIVFVTVAFFANKLIKLPWLEFRKVALIKM